MNLAATAAAGMLHADGKRPWREPRHDACHLLASTQRSLKRRAHAVLAGCGFGGSCCCGHVFSGMMVKNRCDEMTKGRESGMPDTKMWQGVLRPCSHPRPARRSRPAAKEAPASLPRRLCPESQAQVSFILSTTRKVERIKSCSRTNMMRIAAVEHSIPSLQVTNDDIIKELSLIHI